MFLGLILSFDRRDVLSCHPTRQLTSSAKTRGVRPPDGLFLCAFLSFEEHSKRRAFFKINIIKFAILLLEVEDQL
jgi:hypothetical protein